MNRFNNLKIGKRLIISFIIVLITASIGSITGVILLRTADSKYSFALENYGFSQGEVGLLLQSATERKTIVANMVSLTDKEEIKEAQAKLEEERRLSQEYSDKIESSYLDTDEEKEIFNNFKASLEEGAKYNNQILELVLSGKQQEAFDLYQEKGQPAIDQSIEFCAGLLNSFKETGNLLSKQLTTLSFIMTAVILVIILIATVLSLILAVYTTKQISNPIENIVGIAKEISQGNLDVSVSIDRKDEIGELASAFTKTIETLNLYIKDISHILESMGKGDLTIHSSVTYKGSFVVIQESLNNILHNLNLTLSQIGSAASMVSSGSEQIASSGQSLSEGSLEQASAVEELNATISDVSEQIQTNAENAKNAYEKATSVDKEVQLSNEKMNQMLEAMSAINESSKQIEMIMHTIEDISSQTNLLSLNAAIEAARAGDAGKGFAVVANEIRELANQSSEAAKNTNTLIETSIQAVQNGTRIADETAGSLHIVVDGARQVQNNVANITKASQKQADAIQEVTQSIDQISGVVQNNSATAEESAAASQELSSQATTLNELIHQFQLKEV